MTRRSPFHAAWWKKFRDLPIVGGRSIITPHDGDIAQLNELVEKIFGHPRLRLDEDDMLPPDWLWERTVAGTGIDPDAMQWDAHSVGRPCSDCLLWDWKVTQ